MGRQKRTAAPDWDVLVAKFEAAGARNLVGFAKAHGVKPVPLQFRWHRLKQRRWEGLEEEKPRFVDVEVVSLSMPSSSGLPEMEQGGPPALEFEWSPGLRLRVPSGGDIDSLARLVGAVTREVCAC